MSGHNKWSKVKHIKAATDARKSKAFSKMARMIAFAARNGGNPETNFSLRLSIEKARAINMPNDNIQRAIKRGTGEDKEKQLKEVILEAYGPNGIPLIIKTITDNKNRTLAEIKHILNSFDSKLAEYGSVLYLFNKENEDWKPKYPMKAIDDKHRNQLKKLLEALNKNEDINEIYSNIDL